MWAKGQKQQSPMSKDNIDELYTDVRDRALRTREPPTSGIHSDMKLLYEFWSHFLCRNFNPTMYYEFRKFALEDAENNIMDGTRSLISYYDETLNNKKKVIPEVLAGHYVDLVRLEKASSSADRPAFTKLRSSWRNGALDLKSRKRIGELVGPELKAELER
jgi:la-related protein 1